MNSHIHFLGGGRIARIMLGGWTRCGFAPSKIASVSVFDPNPTVVQSLKQQFSFVHESREKPPKQTDLMIVAVHPPILLQAISPFAGQLSPNTLVLSVAPKISIAKIADTLHGSLKIARSLPNAPALINQGFNPIAFDDSLDDAARDRFVSFLEPLGSCPVVPEKSLEAFAVLTAMGPTYFWFQMQQLRELATTFGLSTSLADRGLAETIKGAADLLLSAGLTAQEVMDLVPVKPMHDDEISIREVLTNRLTAMHQKLTQ